MVCFVFVAGVLMVGFSCLVVCCCFVGFGMFVLCFDCLLLCVLDFGVLICLFC